MNVLMQGPIYASPLYSKGNRDRSSETAIGSLIKVTFTETVHFRDKLDSEGVTSSATRLHSQNM